MVDHRLGSRMPPPRNRRFGWLRSVSTLASGFSAASAGNMLSAFQVR
jgi:hypothetical protein